MPPNPGEEDSRVRRAGWSEIAWRGVIASEKQPARAEFWEDSGDVGVEERWGAGLFSFKSVTLPGIARPVSSVHSEGGEKPPFHPVR